MLKAESMKVRFAAAVCLALGIGLVVFSYKDRQKYGETTEGKPAPVTKSHSRERDGRELRTKNPREEFEAARKRGLTEEEVRGVVEEFVSIGLMDEHEPDATVEDLLARRQKEQRWYLDTLTDGFGFSNGQKNEAKRKLRESLAEDYARYMELGKSGDEITIFKTDGDPFLRTEDPFLSDQEIHEMNPAARMLGVSLWLGLGKLSPWELCGLDEGQKEMVGQHDASGQWTRVDGRSRTLDAGSDERYEDLDDPFAEVSITLSAAGAIFPLSMGQVDRMRVAKETYRFSKLDGVMKPKLLDEVKVLTAPQLRTLLLFRPEMAEELMKELGE